MSQIIKNGSGGGSTPYSASFLAVLMTDKNNVTGDGTPYHIAFDGTLFDTAAAFTTGPLAQYTFPRSGKWAVSCSVCYQPSATSGNLFVNDLVLTTNTFRELTSLQPGASQFLTLGSNTVVQVTAGDTLFVNAQNNGGTPTTNILGNGGGATQLTFLSGFYISD